MSNNNNILMALDSYKASHFEFYPENVEYISSYIESRGGDYDFTVFFGLQKFLKELLRIHPDPAMHPPRLDLDVELMERP